MDISGKVKQEDKAKIANLSIECQVLQNLLNERKADVQAILGRVLRDNTTNPALYDLRVQDGKWELVLKASTLVTPPLLNRAERRHPAMN